MPVELITQFLTITRFVDFGETIRCLGELGLFFLPSSGERVGWHLRNCVPEKDLLSFGFFFTWPFSRLVTGIGLFSETSCCYPSTRWRTKSKNLVVYCRKCPFSMDLTLLSVCARSSFACLHVDILIFFNHFIII